ncbi:MAG TPA: PDR/VanB family oxidoreductase [Ramlibacter sp.]|nr:PDR/VanB family oxidoreductase [Ramlibacter sp.]
MNTLQAELHAIEKLANGIHCFDLRPADDSAWPAPTAGSHLDLHLPNGLVRSYSLINAPGERHRYLVAVNREQSGRGGSSYLHDQLRVGQTLTVSGPRNHFPLREDARHSVLIGGGIGITPLWSMVQRLSQIGAPWTLHYAARNRETAAFVDRIESLAAVTGRKVHLNFDGGASDRRLDLRAIVENSPADADFYCCGPLPMLEAFESATAQRDPIRVHREYFAAPAAATAAAGTDHAFTVHLAKTGKTIPVLAGTSILDAVLQAGVDVSYSCMGGICGACVTGVLSGVPDHRDLVLSESEREACDRMVICCSRSKTPELMLDL